ncbi:MAG: TIGR03118 family protein [Acidobacteriia bacterium]|nr:TIGR03118 family protein [Terriglobia bacterium]
MRHASLNCILSSAALLALTWSAAVARSDDDGNGANVYVQHNLVSDIAGMADHTDTNLVNAWGIAHSPAGPWWVNANGAGLAIVYTSGGALFPAVNPVMIPAPGGGAGAPTGIVFNGSMDFQLAPVMPAMFLFVTEDGTVLGWNPMVNAHQAVIKVNNSPAAVYKGATLGRMGGHLVLYVANFRGGTVDAFDTNFNSITLPSGAFHDGNIPAGFAPFNVQNIDGSIFVTYAKQDALKHDDVPGPGLGYVDQFTPEGRLVNRLQHGDWLNSPWGVVKAPGNFGKLSQRLLVGNFGSGQIAAFNAESGKFQSMMNDPNGKPVTIDGLWGLNFGNGFDAGAANVLFFAAGIQGESHGLFGTLAPATSGDGDDGDGEQGHGHHQ